MDADASGESLNLPSVGVTEALPESSDAVNENDVNQQDENEDSKMEHMMTSLNSMVKKELRDLSENLPDGNLGNLKVLDVTGGVITEHPSTSEDVNLKRGLPEAEELIHSHENKKAKKGSKTPQGGRKTWDQRAATVFAYLHQRIGHKDYHLTAEIAKVSPNTLRGWISKAALMTKWVPFLDSMNAEQAANILGLDLNSLGVGKDEVVDASEFKKVLAKKNMTPVKIQEGLKRVQSNPRCSKWHPQFLHLKKILDRAFQNGKPVSIRYLRESLVEQFDTKSTRFINLPEATPMLSTTDEKSTGAPLNPIDQVPLPDALRMDSDLPVPPKKKLRKPPLNDAENRKRFAERYLCYDGKNFPTLINTFIVRNVSRAGYMLREKHLVEALPFDWQHKCRIMSKRFLGWFNEINADCLVCSAEVFVPLNDREDNLVSSVDKEAELSPGYVVFSSCTLPSSTLLPPIIVEKASEDSSQMETIRQHSEAESIQTKEGEMTIEVMKEAMKSILKKCSGKTVAWLLGRSTLHEGPEFERLVEDINSNTDYPGSLHVFYIEPGFSTAMNIFEVALRKEIRSSFRYMYDKRLGDSVQYDDLPGIGMAIPPFKDTVELIEETWKYINTRQGESQQIQDAFTKCGQNPFVADETISQSLTKHLEDVHTTETMFLKAEGKIKPDMGQVSPLELNLP